ncbi:MAG: hypothetical protein EA422_15275 [Gemmatimonadales bacterium]|nr:MAG: hypothetical protein EA422_15275 [Gemmatimonadales bacterium]
MPTGPRIRIRLLAPLDSQGADGDDVSLPGGKPLALLVYLAHHPDGVLRDELAALLWPNRPERRSRGSLRQALWTLRKHLGEEVFASQDPVQLAPGRVTTDVQEVEALIEEGRLTEALELWSVPPFRLFPHPGSRAWNRWTEEVRNLVERRFGRALLDQGRRALRTTGPDAALEWFEAALRVEPHRRSAHEARIQALLLLNRLDEAEAALVEAARDGGAGRGAGSGRTRAGTGPPGAVAGDPDPTWSELAVLREQIRAARPGSYRRAADERGDEVAGESGDTPASRDTLAPHGRPGSGGPQGAGAPPASGAAQGSGSGEAATDGDPTSPPADTDGAPPRRRVTDRTHPRTRDLPLMGGHAIRSELIARWIRAHAGTTQVVTLLAEPGAGKRRMVAELERAARIQQATILRIRGLRGGGEPPLTALGRLVNRLIECPGAAGTSIASEQILRRFVPSRTNDPQIFAELTSTSLPETAPERRRAPGPLGARDPTPVAIADALVDLLGAVSDDAPLLLVLEEVHRMDGESREIITLALRELARHPVMAVVTATPTLPTSDVGLALDQLVGEGGERAFELERWGPTEAGRLADALGGRLTADELLAVGEGHPGLTMAAVEVWLEAGADGDGRAPELPPHIRDRWLGRWERLDYLPRRILGRVAGSREPVPVEAILAVDPAERDDATAAVDRLLAEGLLRLLPGLSLTPVHRELAALILPRWRAEQAAMRKTGGVGAGAGAGFGWGESPGALRTLTFGAGAVATLVLLLAIFLPMGQAESPPPAPFGGGTLFFMGRDEIVEVTPDHGPPSEWAMRTFTPTVGALHQRTLPLRSRDGEIHWIAQSTRPAEKPWISLVTSRGVEELYRTEGDDFAEALTPDGRRLLVLSQRLDVVEYQRDLYLVELDPGEAIPGEDSAPVADADVELPRRRIHEATGTLRRPVMSPDGRRIAFFVEATTDTLVVATPLGERVHTRALSGLHRLAWCGDLDGLFLTRSQAGVAGVYHFRPDRAALEPIPTPGPTGGPLACSPDGSHLIYLAVIQGELLPVLHALDDHTWTPLPIPARSLIGISWLPETGSAVPQRLEIEGATVPLNWGEARRLQPRLGLSDGGSAPAEGVTWRSSDPAVVSVTESGLMFGNGLGQARITAWWDGWLAGSVTVEVQGEEGRGAFLQDPLAELDPGVWRQVGYPPARPVERDGESVVLLDGDALYRDGVISAEAWPFPRGLTAEVEFRLPLTRTDKQWFFLCLAETDLPSASRGGSGGGSGAGGSGAGSGGGSGGGLTGASGFEHHDLPMRQEACFRYPRGFLSTFDPTRGTFEVATGFPQVGVDLSAHLPTDDWAHAALQMRADGTLTLLVNRTPVATSPLRLRNGANTEWRVVMYGSSWETEALVRNFTLWDEPRYPVELANDAQ